MSVLDAMALQDAPGHRLIERAAMPSIQARSRTTRRDRPSNRTVPSRPAGPALLLNLVTFFIYWVDKHAAQTGQWRISENTLHLFSLMGGWPGAWCAQQSLRHKSSKASFQLTYGATVALHCGLLTVALFNQRLQALLLNI